MDAALGVGEFRGAASSRSSAGVVRKDDPVAADHCAGSEDPSARRLHRRGAALDADYAKKLGVDTDNLSSPSRTTASRRSRSREILIRSGALDVIVVDSVAALVPKAEIEGEMGEAQMGLQARLMSQALRKLTAIVSKSRTSLIFINQIREKIGVMFGNPETTTGGRALKFYSSIRIDIRRIASLKDGDVVVGSRTKVKVVKNKVAAPFRRPSST